MLLMDAGQDDPPHAPVVYVVRQSERFAAIHGDLVAAVRQGRANLLGELLESAVVIGNAPRANDRDLQGRSPEMDSDGVDKLTSTPRGVLLNHQIKSWSETLRRAWMMVRLRRMLSSTLQG